MDRNDLRFSFAALPGRVWEAMSNPDKAAVWLPGGWVAEVGRRFTLPGTDTHRISGEVIAVDPPGRVALRWRHTSESGAGTESVMTWVVAPAPGGASVQVIMPPIDDPSAAADVIAAIRTLFDKRLRSALRGRAPAPAAGAARSGPDLPVDVAAPAGPAARAAGEAASGGPVVEGRSQAVSVWPALRRAKVRPVVERARRRPGPALALRLLAVIAVALAVAAITIGAGVVPWSTAPDESPLADGVAGMGSPVTFDPAAQATLEGNSPGSAGTAPGTGAAPTNGSTGISVPPPIPELTVALQIVNAHALGYTVNVTITNPAGSPQAWQNLTVHIVGLSLLIDVVGSAVNVVLDGDDPCFAPAAATSVNAGSTLTFSFTVTGAPGLSEPTQALLNQAAC